MSELTDLIGVEVEDTRRGPLTEIVYEIVAVEDIDNATGREARFELELVEGRKCNRTRTHMRPELREMINDGSYEIR